jgi:transcriptional regulator with XRE-family HTH domain
VRPRRKHIRSPLSARETEIAGRLIEARRLLGLDQAEAARKVGIPKSTLASYELCISPLRTEIALRICLNLIISEEWLATGRFKLAERVGREKGLSNSTGMEKIYLRQCMDLLHSPEAVQLEKGKLFSEGFDEVLAGIYAERIKAYFYVIGIPHSSWDETNIELGFDINAVLIERFILLVQNEALRRKCTPQHAAATYLGFLMRMTILGFNKCMEHPMNAQMLGIPLDLFSDSQSTIGAFVPKEALNADRRFAPIVTRSPKQSSPATP